MKENTALQSLPAPELLWIIERNYPGTCSTFGLCSFCGRCDARGGYCCAGCAADELKRRGGNLARIIEFQHSCQTAANTIAQRNDKRMALLDHMIEVTK